MNSDYNNAINIYRILDSVGVLNPKEIVEYEKKLSEDELKIYHFCVSILKKEREDSPRDYKILLDAIHCNTSSLEFEDRELADIYFSEINVIEKIENIAASIKELSTETAVLTNIVEKLDKRPAMLEGDLADLLADVRESEGVDDYMHRIFLTTNEAGHAKILASLKQQPMIGNTFVDGHGGNTMIAVSGFCGLNLTSVRGEESEDAEAKIDNLIILDRSGKVEAFWKAMREIILSSETRHEVIEKLENLVKKDEMFKVTLPRGMQYNPLIDLRNEIKAGNSWLSSTRRFKIIKAIFDSNRFIFKRIDVTDLEAMQSLKDALQRNDCKVDTFYASNISEYLQPAEQEIFKQGVLKLAGDRLLVVDTIPRQSEKEILTQRIVMLSKENIDPSFCTSSIAIIPKVS